MNDYIYESLDAFLRHEGWENGTHKILVIPGITLDVLVGNNPEKLPTSSRIPVFFSGARKSNARPPVFSGQTLSQELGYGIFAFSDPILYYDEHVTTGWYAGIPTWHIQFSITKILKRIAQVYHRNVVCIGGSAGGFAALHAASSLENGAAFVWNPQTSILDYSSHHVRRWLNLLLGNNWYGSGEWREQAEVLLGKTEIIHNLNNCCLPANLLYLQNDTDWHVDSHMRPFVFGHGMSEMCDGEGVYLGTPQQIVALGHFGEGHIPPPREVIVRGVQDMVNGDMNAIREKWFRF